MRSAYVKAILSMLMFVFTLMSYGPFVATIDEYATNATLTNAIWVLLDTIFPLFWALIGIVWLIIAIWALFSD
jgi:hypothetical protein